VREDAPLRPLSGAYEQPIKAAVKFVADGGDANVRFVDTTGWLDASDYRDGTHPNGVGNLKIMGRLVPILRSLVPTK
jgi:hypothetical protein